MVRVSVAALRVPALAVFACAAPPSSTPAASVTITMPGPHRGRSDPARLAQNDACVACHADIADEWSSSLHRRAFVDPDFAGAYAREPTPFCRGCHAAEADPRASTVGAAAAVGVACVTCHAPEGAVLPADGVLAAVGGLDGDAPHPVVRDPAFTRADACGSCHDFGHPRAPEVPMQSTLHEHQASPAAAIGCAECHMRGGDPAARPSHRFAAARDPDRLRSAVTIRAERPDDGRVRVTLGLDPRAIGHAFPTGDMFRRLVVDVEVVDDDGDAILGDARILGKTYEDRRIHGVRARSLIADDRLRPEAGEVAIDLDIAGADGLAARWRVLYQRVDQEHPEDAPRILAEVVLAEGSLPSPQDLPP